MYNRNIATTSYAKGNPHVEPHMVAGITRVLKPAAMVTGKGDGYRFFRTIFSEKLNN